MGYLFNWPAYLININILQIALILTVKIIMSIRFKMKAIDILLHPLSIVYLISIAINSARRAKFHSGLFWKDKVYDVLESSGEEDDLDMKRSHL